MDKEQGIIIDTDVLINLFDTLKSGNAVAEVVINYLKVSDVPLFVSIVSEIELIQGTKPSTEVRRLVKELTSFQTITLNDDISVIAKDLVIKYGSSHGLKLGDSLIAATALHLNIPLYTFNKRDFRFIAGLNLYEP